MDKEFFENFWQELLDAAVRCSMRNNDAEAPVDESVKHFLYGFNYATYFIARNFDRLGKKDVKGLFDSSIRSIKVWEQGKILDAIKEEAVAEKMTSRLLHDFDENNDTATNA